VWSWPLTSPTDGRATWMTKAIQEKGPIFLGINLCKNNVTWRHFVKEGPSLAALREYAREEIISRFLKLYYKYFHYVQSVGRSAHDKPQGRTQVNLVNKTDWRIFRILIRLTCFLRCPSLVSAIGIATAYGLDGRSFEVRVAVGATFFFSPRCPDRFWGQLSLLSNG
jgi:hypothetical protein